MPVACAKMRHRAQGNRRVPRPAPLVKTAWQYSISDRTHLLLSSRVGLQSTTDKLLGMLSSLEYMDAMPKRNRRKTMALLQLLAQIHRTVPASRINCWMKLNDHLLAT